MKTHPSRRPGGFTLVELLVVIAIIAVLAAAGFAAGTAAVNRARRTTALFTATSLESAISQFYSEYNTPPKAIDSDTKLDTSKDTDVLNELLGYTGSISSPINTRSMKFLTVKEGKANKNGLIISGTGTSTKADGLYDPWGGAYYVMLDGDYDEVVTPAPSAGGSTKALNGRKSAVWSNGADATKGSGGSAGDDVITWQK